MPRAAGPAQTATYPREQADAAFIIGQCRAVTHRPAMEIGEPSNPRGYDTYSLWQQQQQRTDEAAAGAGTQAGAGAPSTAAPAPVRDQAHGNRGKSSHLSLLKRLKHLLQCTVPASTTDLALHAQRLTQPPSTQQQHKQQRQQEQQGRPSSHQPAAAGRHDPLGLQQQVAAVGEGAAMVGTPDAAGPHTTISSDLSTTAIATPHPAGPVGAQRQLFVQAAAAAGIPVVVPPSWPTTGASAGPPAASISAAAPSVVTAGQALSPPSSSGIAHPSSSSVPAPICRRSLVDLGAALAAARAAGSPSVVGVPLPLRRSSVIISPKSKRSVFRHRAHLRTSLTSSSTTTLAPLPPAPSDQLVPLQQQAVHVEAAAATSYLSQQHPQTISHQPATGSSAGSTCGAGSSQLGADVGSSSKGVTAGASSSKQGVDQVQHPAQHSDAQAMLEAAGGGAWQQQLQGDQDAGHQQQQDMVPAALSGQASATADTAAFLGKPRRLLQQAGASSTPGEAADLAPSWGLGFAGQQQDGSQAVLQTSAGSGPGLVPCAGVGGCGLGGGAGVFVEEAQSAPRVSSTQVTPGSRAPVVTDQEAAAGGGTTPQLTCWGSGAVSSDGWPNSRGGSRSITPLAGAAPPRDKDAPYAEQGLAQLLGPQLAARGAKTISSSSDAEEYASCSSLLEGMPAAAAAAVAAAGGLAVNTVESGCGAGGGTGQLMLPSASDLGVGRPAGSDVAASWLAPWAPEGVPAADAAAATAAAATWEAMGGALAAYGQGSHLNESHHMDGSQVAQQQQQQRQQQQQQPAWQQQQQQQPAWQQPSSVFSPTPDAVASPHTAGWSTPGAPSSSRQTGMAEGAAIAASSSGQVATSGSPGKQTGDDSGSKDTARHKDQHLVKLLRQLSINSIITADEQQVLPSPTTAAGGSPETPGGGPSSPAAPNSSSFRRLGTGDADNHTTTGDVSVADAQLRLYYTGSSSSSEGYGGEDGGEGCDSGDTSLLEQWLLESHAGGAAAGTSSRVSSRAASINSSRSAAVQRGKGHGPSRLARSSLAGASRNSSFEAVAAAAGAAQRMMEAPPRSMLAAPADGLAPGGANMAPSGLTQVAANMGSHMQLQVAVAARGAGQVDSAAPQLAAATSQAAPTSSEGLVSGLLAQQLAALGFAWPTSRTTAPAVAAAAAQQVTSHLDEVVSGAFTDCAWPSAQAPGPGVRCAVSSSARAAAQVSAVAGEGQLDSMPSMAFTDCAWPHAGGTHSAGNSLAAPAPAATGAPFQQVVAALRRSAAAGAGREDVLSSLVGATLAQQLRWPDTCTLAPAPPASITTAEGPVSEEQQYTEQGASSGTAVVSLQGGLMGTSAADSDASLELGVATHPLAAAAEPVGAGVFGLPRDSWMRSSFNPLYDSPARAVTPPPIPAAQDVATAAIVGDGAAARVRPPPPAPAVTASMQRPPVPRPPKGTQGWPHGPTQDHNQTQQQGLLHADNDQPQPRQTPPPPPLQQQQQVGVQALGLSMTAGRVGAVVPGAQDPQRPAAVAPVHAAAAALQPGTVAGLSSSAAPTGQQQQGVPSLLQRLIEDLSCLNTLIAQQGLQEAESAQLKQVLMSDALQQLQGHLQAPTAATQAAVQGITAAPAAPAGVGAGVPRSPKDRAAAAVASKMIRNSIDLLTALTSGSNIVKASSNSPQQRLAAAFSSSLYGVSSLQPPTAAAVATPLGAPAVFPGEDSAWQGAETSAGRGMGGPFTSSEPASHPSGAPVGEVAAAVDGRGGLAGTAGNGLAPLTVRLHQAPHQSSSDGSNSTNVSAPLVVVQQGGQQVKLSHFRPSLENTLQQQMTSVVQAQLQRGAAATTSSARGSAPPDVLHGLKWAQKLAKQAAVARPGPAAAQAPPAAAVQDGGAGPVTNSGHAVVSPTAGTTGAQALAAPVGAALSDMMSAAGQDTGVGGGSGVCPSSGSPAVTPRAIPCSSPTPGMASALPAPAVLLESGPALTVRAPSMQLLGADADLASADVLLGSPMMRSQNSFLAMRPLSTPASMAPSSTGVAAATPTAAVSQAGGLGGSSFGSPALGGQQQGYVTPGVPLPSLGGSPGGLVCPGGPRPPSRAISRRPPQLVSATSPTLPPAAATAAYAGPGAADAGGPTSPFRCSKNLLPVFEAEVAAGAGWSHPQLAVQGMLPQVSEDSVGPHTVQQPSPLLSASHGVPRPSISPLASSSPRLAGATSQARSSSQTAAGVINAARCSQAAGAAELLKDQLVARLSGRDIGAMSLEELDHVYRSLSSNLREVGDAGSPTPAAVL